MNPIRKVEQALKNTSIDANPRNRLYMAGSETLQDIRELVEYADEAMRSLNALAYLYTDEVRTALPQEVLDKIRSCRGPDLPIKSP